MSEVEKMLSDELINKAKGLGANEKDAFLEKLLIAINNLEDTVASKKAASEGIMTQSRTAVEEIMKILNDKVQLLEKENVELKRKIDVVLKDTGKLDELNAAMQRLATEHHQLEGAYERALKEKTEADEKLAGIQQQWETFMRGV